MSTGELMDWVICGRKIGQVTGWDVADAYVINLYGLIPDPEYMGPISDCLVISFERGLIEVVDDATGKVTIFADLIESIKDCPVDRIQ